MKISDMLDPSEIAQLDQIVAGSREAVDSAVADLRMRLASGGNPLILRAAMTAAIADHMAQSSDGYAIILVELLFQQAEVDR